ncbi:MAG TPA: ATP-binding protein [Chthonomonadaceae bacterium]|nr:ATP-binding protein [Chthonomonadaceae bacterium]
MTSQNQPADQEVQHNGHSPGPTIALSPAQQKAFEGLMHFLPLGNVFVFSGGIGKGKTTVLRHLHATLGGAYLTLKDFIDAQRDQNPLAMEETFERLLMQTLQAHDTVILDDLDLIYGVVCDCGYTAYPRKGFLDAPLTMLAVYAAEAGKKLIFGNHRNLAQPISERAYRTGIHDFEAGDYAFLCSRYLDAELVQRLDFAKIHRFAPNLNAHQLKSVSAWFQFYRKRKVDTEAFIDYLRSQQMASNVELGEVQAVDLHTLKGVDDVIRSLEANIILPLENDELAMELGIKPKRGVLLAGPPGTGKTTIGRALAHRLKSKFFLIDGTVISGTREFYGRVHQIFQLAEQNAPSVIFIDDSDVIFESGSEGGLYRYLLTMLDGLESESAARVCVMMTAMNVGNLPPALMRSGRVELWLETRLPDREARAAILREQALTLPASLSTPDIAQLAEATENMTGADLKRLIEDGKLLYAYDRSQGLPMRPTTEYFLAAVETVQANKERYAEAEALARQQRPQRPPWFDVMSSMAMMGMSYEE